MLPLYAGVDYSSEIQPIFNSRCTNCHSGSDAEEDLSLTSYNNVMNGGDSGDVVIPYDYANSLLWQYINSGFMPPGTNDLTLTQIDLIAQWIDEGALPEASNPSCDGDYTHIEDLPNNLVNNNNEDQCFFNDDLAVIDDLISLNDLSYSNVLEVGVQSWNSGRIFSWVLTYTQNGNSYQVR